MLRAYRVRPSLVSNGGGVGYAAHRTPNRGGWTEGVAAVQTRALPYPHTPCCPTHPDPTPQLAACEGGDAAISTTSFGGAGSAAPNHTSREPAARWGVGRITPQDNVRSRSHDGPGVRASPGGSGARWVVYMTPDGAQLASTRSVCAQVPSVASSRWCAPSPSHAHATRPSRYTRRVVLVYLYSCTCVRGGLRRGALVCRGAAVE